MVVDEKKYLDYFYKISKIYRKSGSEKDIAKFIINFAKERNLKYYTDNYYNVIIWKEASVGYEDKEIIGLQAHTDMVCEKREGIEHNFEDGVEVYSENGYLQAKGTTLGADNGIGVSYILAVLDSKDIAHPKIEAIFTTQEETTMDGVKNIDSTVLLSKKIISFDNFSLGDIWIGSASSKEWYTETNMNSLNTDRRITTYKLKIENFLGGHSGMDIKDSTRGNPIKIASEILSKEDVFINEINGGSAINVIPRDCYVTFSFYKENESKVIKNLNELINDINKKYPIGDITLEKEKEKTLDIFDLKSSKRILKFIHEFKNGALSIDKSGNVIVSANFSKIITKEQKVCFEFAIRSNREEICKKYIDDLKKNMTIFKVKTNKYDEWKGYEQPDNTELINICVKKYIEVIGQKPNILGVQACLECEFLNEKVKNLQYVALGTNIYGAHSPNEKVEIQSIEKTWKVLIKILRDI